MKERKITCIICPRGCRLTLKIKDNKIIKCSGNHCKRGEEYANLEVNSPVRVLTTTVATTSKAIPRLPVKTSSPIPKQMLFDAMELTRKICVDFPVKSGDIIYKDFMLKDVNLVCGRNICAFFSKTE